MLPETRYDHTALTLRFVFSLHCKKKMVLERYDMGVLHDDPTRTLLLLRAHTTRTCLIGPGLSCFRSLSRVPKGLQRGNRITGPPVTPIGR